MKNKTIRVLLIDDDPNLRRSLTRQFEEAGLDVETAISAAEAKVVLERNEFDAVLCDNHMVGTSGTNLLGFIRKNYPDIKRFMLSGDISSSQAFLVEHEIGVCGLFSKPCSSEKLVAAIEQAVESPESAASNAVL